METIFKEEKLTYDPNDDRFDSISDVSSSDDDIDAIDKQRDYIYSKSSSSCKISEIE